MRYSGLKIFICFLCVQQITACKQVYEPPIIKMNHGYLVVDGNIGSGGAQSTVKLSRTRSFNDSLPASPELGAQVSLVGMAGEVYDFFDQGNGSYQSDPLNLNADELYQLKIETGGEEYLSDELTLQQAPPIDSVNWQQTGDGVQVYLSSHDPSNSTHFYKWDFTETWQYRAKYASSFDFIDSQLVARGSGDFIYDCWQTDNATDLLIATTSKLAQDVVYQFPVCFVPRGSEKISVKYSVLVSQYAISAEAYDYWQNLKKNTEQLGTLFDPQPSQVNGNIHSTTDPGEPVIGFVSLSTVQQARIFIDNIQLLAWNYDPYYQECSTRECGPDSINVYFPATGPRYFTLIGTDMGNYVFTTTECGDCREHGGTNIKPAFWP